MKIQTCAVLARHCSEGLGCLHVEERATDVGWNSSCFFCSVALIVSRKRHFVLFQGSPMHPWRPQREWKLKRVRKRIVRVVHAIPRGTLLGTQLVGHALELAIARTGNNDADQHERTCKAKARPCNNLGFLADANPTGTRVQQLTFPLTSTRIVKRARSKR